MPPFGRIMVVYKPMDMYVVLAEENIYWIQ